MSNLTIKGIRVTVGQDEEYFIATRYGTSNNYKPLSLHRNKVELLKQIANLLNVEVEIKIKN